MVIIRLLKWRWWIAGLLIAGLTALEFFEHDSWGINIFYDLEFIFFVSAVLVAGVSFELLAQSNSKLDAALKILDYKHKFNLQLSKEEDWETLTARLVQFPHEIMDVVESGLFLDDSFQTSNALIARWSADPHRSGGGMVEGTCETCLDSNSSKLHLFKRCADNPPQAETMDQGVYCLPISDGQTALAVLRFKMAAGKKPRPAQVVLMENVVDEMAISLKTSQDRKIQADIRFAEANLMQRRDIWRYLHDHLGQNLAYLRLKLDQFSKPAALPPLAEIRTDLQHMRDVTNESYLMVRNWLESKHPESQSQLAELLLEHASVTAKRADFEIEVTSEGQAVPIEPVIQQKIYYIFREIMSNIANHANASKVQVRLCWGSSDLRLTISDNGKGFNAQEIDRSKHFGFKIMNERITELNGRLEQNSSLNVGTVISVWVPVE